MRSIYTFLLVVLSCHMKLLIPESLGQVADYLIVNEIAELSNKGRLLRASQPDSAILYYAQALRLAKKNLYSLGMVDVFQNLGATYWNHAQHEMGMLYFDSALQYAYRLPDDIKYKRISQLLQIKASSYRRLGDNIKSIEYYLQLIRLGVENDLKQETGEGYYRIGDIYRLQRDGEKSLENFQKARAIFEEIENSYWLFYTDDMIYHCYDLLGDTQAAVNGLRSLFHTYLGDISPNDSARTWSNMGRMYIRLEKYDSAENYLQLGKAQFEKVGNLGDSYAHILNEFLTLYKLTGQYDKALSVGKIALEIATRTNYLSLIKNMNRHLSEVYEAKGQYREALLTFKEHKLYSDSLESADKLAAINRLKAEFDMERREQEAAKHAALLEKDKKMALSQRNWAMIGGVLLILIVILIYKGIMTRREKIARQQYAHSLIEEQEIERKRIAKEMHDGIGQSLLLIKNHMASNWNLPETELAIIDQTISEVRAISQNLHPYQLERLGLTKALHAIVEQMESWTTLFVSSEIDDIDGLWKPSDEINVYRAVQEIFNNVIKHSGATATKLSVTKGTDKVEIVVNDNGKGFDWSKQYQKTKSLGLKTLKERMTILSGNIFVESNASKGTKITLSIPVNNLSMA
jgi:signal transduction histidine kinase